MQLGNFIKRLKERKFRNFLINPRFQFKFVAYQCLIAFLIIFTVYFSNFYFFNKFRKTAMQMGMPPGHVFYKFLSLQKMAMDGILIYTFLGAFLIIFIMGIFTSHKLAGPMFNLRRYLLNLENNVDLRPLSFRSTDYFREIADACNIGLRGLKRRLEADLSSSSLPPPLPSGDAKIKQKGAS